MRTVEFALAFDIPREIMNLLIGVMRSKVRSDLAMDRRCLAISRR